MRGRPRDNAAFFRVRPPPAPFETRRNEPAHHTGEVMRVHSCLPAEGGSCRGRTPGRAQSLSPSQCPWLLILVGAQRTDTLKRQRLKLRSTVSRRRRPSRKTGQKNANFRQSDTVIRVCHHEGSRVVGFLRVCAWQPRVHVRDDTSQLCGAISALRVCLMDVQAMQLCNAPLFEGVLWWRLAVMRFLLDTRRMALRVAAAGLRVGPAIDAGTVV